MEHWRRDRQRRARTSCGPRLLRDVTGDGNPLRRPIDRIESAVILGLIVAFVIAAPLLAVFAAKVTGAAATREQTAQRSWIQRKATLRQPASAGQLEVTYGGEASWVEVSWRMPDHAVDKGLVAVALNAKQGQQLPVWVTPAGQLTHPPLTSADVTDRELEAGALAPVGLAVLLLIAGDVVRVVANRRRMADWTRAWEAAGPKWTSRR